MQISHVNGSYINFEKNMNRQINLIQQIVEVDGKLYEGVILDIKYAVCELECSALIMYKMFEIEKDETELRNVVVSKE